LLEAIITAGITVPNPAHAQFISRESTDTREETRSLSVSLNPATCLAVS
jgi:hypothetical protein